MATCQQVYDFLNAVSAKSTVAPLPDADVALLAQAGLLQRLTAAQRTELSTFLQQHPDPDMDVDEARSRAQSLSFKVTSDDQKVHSVLFHLEGSGKRTQQQQQLQQDQAALETAKEDIAAKMEVYNQWVARRSLLGNLTQVGNDFIGLTVVGMGQVGDLRVRLYRYSNKPFPAYWTQMQQVQAELAKQSEMGAAYFPPLRGSLQDVQPADLWSMAFGLADLQPDPQVGVPQFLSAYNAVKKLSPNRENSLLSAEILAAVPGQLPENVTLLTDLHKEVSKMGVPKESSLGVASVMVAGRRYDGSFATDSLRNTLQVTKSYDAAALLAILNRPPDQVGAKFESARQLFSSWGWSDSEDLEVSAAYLTTSELPVEGISTKLQIVMKGLSNYLQYPLVAAAVLSAVPVLEANETLNLLEHAYEAVGARAQGLSAAELICLAVRLVKGIRNETLGILDTTAAVTPAQGAVGRTGGYYPRPMFIFVPLVICHGSYYSTYGGFGGAHPAHAHVGGFGGAGGGG